MTSEVVLQKLDLKLTFNLLCTLRLDSMSVRGQSMTDVNLLKHQASLAIRC